MAFYLGKRWFLLVLLGGLFLAWAWPGALEWTTRVNPQPVMAMALFLSAVTLESQRLFRAIRHPWPAILASAISYGLLPALGWVSGTLLPLADFKIGLMISASVPCTLASAVIWTRMAGGNEATALFTTLITTGISWLATTAWLTATTGRQVELDAGHLMRDLAITLVVPVALGQFLRASSLVCRLIGRFKPAFGVVSRLLILLIMLQAAVFVIGKLEEEAATIGLFFLLLTAALCVGNHLLALACGAWTGRWLGFDRGTCIAVGIAGSQKTLPVSLWLLNEHFPGNPLAIVPMLFYHAGQLLADTWIAEQWAAGDPATSSSSHEPV